MDKYLKMADVFDCEVDSDADLMFSDSLGNIADFSGYKTQCRYAAHAINSHDELVADVERITQSLNHANSNHELFERQYYLEKDKCEELQAEVERLRYENSIFRTRLENSERLNNELLSEQ